jgi:hypothetical protein
MNMINEAVSFPGMLPFDTMGMSLYEQPRPRYILKMPRVVPDQKEKFDSDDIFKKISRDGEVSRRSNHAVVSITQLALK